MAGTPSAAGLDPLELIQFEKTFHQLVDDIVDAKNFEGLPRAQFLMKKVCRYNVPHGKKLRGMMVPVTCKYFQNGTNPETIKLSYVMGWCIEILQASCLVIDDIMDKSDTRRGRKCWHRVANKGSAAYNDGILLQHASFYLLQKYFRGKAYYPKVLRLSMDVVHKTIMGQHLDTKTGQTKNMDEYTNEMYTSIVKYKTSYYTIFLPIALALIMLGKDEEDKLMKIVENISLDIGHFFQINDDYIDCFGDESETGKLGTDIQNCKCSWLFITAKEKCTPKQLDKLKENYGQSELDKVAIVRNLYLELGLPQQFQLVKEKTMRKIEAKLDSIKDMIPSEVFDLIISKLF